MSIGFAAGGAPCKTTFPATEPAVAGSILRVGGGGCAPDFCGEFPAHAENKEPTSSSDEKKRKRLGNWSRAFDFNRMLVRRAMISRSTAAQSYIASEATPLRTPTARNTRSARGRISNGE